MLARATAAADDDDEGETETAARSTVVSGGGEEEDGAVRSNAAFSSRSRSSCARSFCTWKRAATWAEVLVRAVLFSPAAASVPLPGPGALLLWSGCLEEEEEEVMRRSSSESCASPRAWSLLFCG